MILLFKKPRRRGTKMFGDQLARLQGIIHSPNVSKASLFPLLYGFLVKINIPQNH